MFVFDVSDMWTLRCVDQFNSFSFYNHYILTITNILARLFSLFFLFSFSD